MADGKGLCRPPRTANSDGKDRVGKGLLCRLFFAADGKEAFAVSGGRQRARLFTICWQTAKAAGSLPSVGRWQRDQIGINSVSSYINSFSQKIKHNQTQTICMTNIAYPTHITNTHEHIYIQHISMNTYPTHVTNI